MKRRWLWLVMVLAVGCSHGQGLKRDSGFTLSVQRNSERGCAFGPVATEDVTDSRPMVTVIRGREVSGKEDAQDVLDGRMPAPTGLSTPLVQIFLNGVTVKTLAGILTDSCDCNVVASREVAERRLSLYLKSVTLREALETLCRLHGLWYREGPQVVTLMTREEYTRELMTRHDESTRAYYVRYTNAADMAKIIAATLGDQVVLSKVEKESVYGYLETDEEADVKMEDVAGEVEARLSDPSAGGGAEPTSRIALLTVSRRNNCVLARSADPNILAEIGKIVEVLDTPTNQVLLEMRILQVTLGDRYESFFQIAHADTGTHSRAGAFEYGVGTLGGMSVPSTNSTGTLGGMALPSETLGFLFDSAKIDARIQLFQSQGRAETIASPFLMCANNSTVEFFVGEETPLRDEVSAKTVTPADTDRSITTVEVDIKREELGTDVKIATFINEDNTITMEIETEISTPSLGVTEVGVINENTGQVVPFPLDGVNTNKIKTIVCARSEQSIAIGGIIREVDDLNEKKVPILGDIPILGFFFKDRRNQKTKTETVIVLTPHIIMHPALAGKATRDFLKRRSSHPQVTRGLENLLEFERSPEEMGRVPLKGEDGASPGKEEPRGEEGR